MKILLIEPDKLLGDTYCRALEAQDHNVLIAHGAQTAVKMLDSQAETPDVIVMELQMAGHNGIELIYELRSYPEWHKIPIIINSIVPSHAIELPVIIRKSLGIQAYLYKPTTSLGKLIDKVEQLVPAKV